MRLIVAALSAFLAASPALSNTERWMRDGELKSAFSGRTIDGIYSNGITFTEIYMANGRLDYIEGVSRRLAGRWSVVESTFCTLYDDWPTGGCYRVRRMSENCYEFYFAASDEQEAAEGGSQRPRWTARAWVTDRPSTCKVVPSV